MHDKFSQPVAPVIRELLLLTTVAHLPNQGTLRDLGVISPGAFFGYFLPAPMSEASSGEQQKVTKKTADCYNLSVVRKQHNHFITIKKNTQ